MIRLPVPWVEWLAQIHLFRRPHLLTVVVDEAPFDDEMTDGYLYHEVRGGYSKWAHLVCPRCGDHLQLELTGRVALWSLNVDRLNRPTLAPSVWEKNACGAHFFIRRGNLDWCE